MSWRRVPLALLAGMALAACDRGDVAGSASDAAPPAERAARDASEIDRLRALGYLDFADESMDPGAPVVTIHDPERSAPGANLYVSQRLCRADLIDARGKVLRSWKHGPCAAWSNAELAPDGDLLVQGRYGRKNRLLRFAWNGRLIWSRQVGAHHDVEIRPDGRIAVLVERERRIPAVDAGRVTLDHGIALLDPEGELLEEHSLYDMLLAAPDVLEIQPVAPTGRSVDLFHANSVEFMDRPELAQRSDLYAAHDALVSMRHQDAIAIFDVEAGMAIWAWGRGELSGPHDASLLENGNLLVFDNGLGRGWSRVVELDPLTKRIVWEYRAPRPGDFYTAGRGSSQRLPNGNTLIADSDHGVAFEVTPAGETVWRFQNPLTSLQHKRATIVRMKRYAPTFVAELERRASEKQRER